MAHIYNIGDLRSRLERHHPSQQCYCYAALGSRQFFDQELNELQKEYAHPKVLCLDSLVFPDRHKGFPSTSPATEQNWDFIYSCELLGGLPDVAAKQAVKVAWAGLKPGGRALLANTYLADHISACPTCASPGRANRTELELAELVKDLPDTLLAGKAVFRDDKGLNVYLELFKSPNPPRSRGPVS